MNAREESRGDVDLVSILVCTRNRRENVVPTVRSIQACGYANFELFVLDHSDDDSTKDALASTCAEDPRVQYVAVSRPGKPLALSEGLRRARGQYILLTDDDCEVRPGWASAMVSAFQSDPRVACIFGAVEAAAHDASAGYIPDRTIEQPSTFFGLSEFLTMPGWKNFGMGANMALRARVLKALGGWDLCLGPGAKFASNEDTDVAVRCLIAGSGIHLSPAARVLHYGFRHWRSAKRDISIISFGLGVMFAKYLRLGVVFHGGVRTAQFYSGQALQCLLRGQRPAGALFTMNWCRGVLAGSRHPIDRETRMFRPDRAGDDYREHIADVVLREDPTFAEFAGEKLSPAERGRQRPMEPADADRTRER